MSLPLLVAKQIGSKTLLLRNSRSLALTVERNAGYWNKDWRPKDEIPKTEEERRAAAKKYGLIVEDYEPYPEDDGYGDYPMLPLISAESRDPHALYDEPGLKRNFGETMHIDFDMVGEDRWDYNRRYYVPLHKQLMMFLGAIFLTFTLSCLGEYVRVIPCPKMPKQMPNDGKKHLTFELEDVE